LEELKAKFDEADKDYNAAKLEEDEEGTDLINAINELTELTETSSANSINICRLGGMIYLLETIVSNDSEDVRIAACRLFASITGNNKKVQWFASLAGAVNLSA